MKTFATWSSSIVLSTILVLAVGLRLYRVTQPVADWHSWRQADTASVTREYVKHGVDMLHPTFHDLSNIPSGLDNPRGYRMVEFPVVNAGLAVVLRALPFLDLVTVSRLASIVASVIMIAALYFLTKRWYGVGVASWTGLAAATLPYAVYYGRTILPEPFLLAALLTSLLCLSHFLSSRNWGWAAGFVVSFTLALLLKPFALFFLPVIGALILAEHGTLFSRNFWRDAFLVASGVGMSAIPLYWWRHWILQYPSGIPASDWLFNGNGIRLRPAWWRWLGYERIIKLFLGGVGVVFFPMLALEVFSTVWSLTLQLFSNKGKLSAQHTRVLLWLSWWISAGAYLIIIATGNVQHDYYQNLLIPPICLSIGWGAVLLEERLHALKVPWSRSVVAGLFILMLLASWQQVKGYFNINHWEYVEAGQAVDRLLPSDAKVIAPAQGDTQFLFQTNRTGWPMAFDIEHKRSLGATYYVTTNFDDEANALDKQYKTVIKTPTYWILDLTTPR
jgi:hypothetical protein